MNSSVDLTNLRAIIEDDKALEKMLFEEFLNSSRKNITDLANSMEDSASTTWRESAHALKGNSLNLGAMQLSELCKKAQNEHTAPKTVKEEILQNIRAEYQLVCDFVLTQI